MADEGEVVALTRIKTFSDPNGDTSKDKYIEVGEPVSEGDFSTEGGAGKTAAESASPWQQLVDAGAVGYMPEEEGKEPVPLNMSEEQMGGPPEAPKTPAEPPEEPTATTAKSSSRRST